MVEIFITSFLLKGFIAICDTPFVYWARKMKFPKKPIT